MRAWRVHRYGSPLEVLRLEDVELPVPGVGEVRVKVAGIPLNLNDLERITGGNMMVRPELPYSPGMEVMGTVDATGPACEDWLGKRVVAATRGAHGGYAEYAACPAAGTFPIPDSIPLPDAAALYFPFHLAWLGLIDRAGLRSGESVLVHAGAGGAGSAAIQLARHLGARVFATAGTAGKTALCRDLGAEIAVDYDSFSDIVLDQTEGRGVDAVFDTVGESVMEASLRCTAYNGRYLMMGFASNKLVADEPFIVPRRVALGNVKLCGVLLAYADDETRGLVKTAMGWNFPPTPLGSRIMEKVVGLYEQHAIRAVVGRTADFAEIPDAIDSMGRRGSTGRTVVLL